jgi:hypothetical protein
MDHTPPSYMANIVIARQGTIAASPLALIVVQVCHSGDLTLTVVRAEGTARPAQNACRGVVELLKWKAMDGGNGEGGARYGAKRKTHGPMTPFCTMRWRQWHTKS